MKQLSKFYLFFSLFIFSKLGLAEIKRPNFVPDVSPDAIDSAGQVVITWVFGVIGVFIGLYAAYAGYLFISGDAEKGMEAGKNIIIGAVISALLAGVVFAVLEAIK